MTIEQYERTYEQNEDLGLNDMKTENYETSWPLRTLLQQKNIKSRPLCHFNSKIIHCSHQWMLQTNKLREITAMKVHKTVGEGGVCDFLGSYSWLKVQVWFALTTFTIVYYGQCTVIVMFISCVTFIFYMFIIGTWILFLSLESNNAITIEWTYSEFCLTCIFYEACTNLLVIIINVSYITL